MTTGRVPAKVFHQTEEYVPCQPGGSNFMLHRRGTHNCGFTSDKTHLFIMFQAQGPAASKWNQITWVEFVKSWKIKKWSEMSPKPPFSMFLQGKPQFKAGSLCRSINKSCRAHSTGRKMLETSSSAASWPVVKIDKPDTPGPKTTSLTYFWLISSNVTNYTSYVKSKLSNVHAVFPFIEILANICSLNKPFACSLTASAQMFQKQMPQKHVVKKTWHCWEI